MQADKVEVSWDSEHKKWLIRLQVGAEVIRRYCNEPENVAPDVLRASALKTARDEGYSVPDGAVVLR